MKGVVKSGSNWLTMCPPAIAIPTAELLDEPDVETPSILFRAMREFVISPVVEFAEVTSHHNRKLLYLLNKFSQFYIDARGRLI